MTSHRLFTTPFSSFEFIITKVSLASKVGPGYIQTSELSGTDPNHIYHTDFICTCLPVKYLARAIGYYCFHTWPIQDLEANVSTLNGNESTQAWGSYHAHISFWGNSGLPHTSVFVFWQNSQGIVLDLVNHGNRSAAHLDMGGRGCAIVLPHCYHDIFTGLGTHRPVTRCCKLAARHV